ncbi:MAG: hypothetical protein IT195_11185 [Microthrixaceae bacterium]|nr:hypothetical protein [Microthrixaceae bacterium]
MTFITTDCPGCGEVEIPLGDVTLRVCEDDDSARCAIRCVHCGARFSKRVEDGMSLLLVAVGVEVDPWTRPAEVDERPLHLSPIALEEIEQFVSSLRAADNPLSLLPSPEWPAV